MSCAAASTLLGTLQALCTGCCSAELAGSCPDRRKAVLAQRCPSPFLCFPTSTHTRRSQRELLLLLQRESSHVLGYASSLTTRTHPSPAAPTPFLHTPNTPQSCTHTQHTTFRPPPQTHHIPAPPLPTHTTTLAAVPSLRRWLTLMGMAQGMMMKRRRRVAVMTTSPASSPTQPPQGEAGTTPQATQTGGCEAQRPHVGCYPDWGPTPHSRWGV